MLGLTKKPTTIKCVEITCMVPLKNLGKLKKLLAELGAKESSSVTPWREVFPQYDQAVALRGARKKEGMTQRALADILGVSQVHISQMEHNKRPIGKKMAHRLARVLKVDYRAFL